MAVYVTKEDEFYLWTDVKHMITINPMTGEVLDIKGFNDNEL